RGTVDVQTPAGEDDFAFVRDATAVGVAQTQEVGRGGDVEVVVDDLATHGEGDAVGVDVARVVDAVEVRVLEQPHVVGGGGEHLLGGHRVRLGGLEHEEPAFTGRRDEHR